jgi:two-component system, chemotaxis family, response regulator Rcp1
MGVLADNTPIEVLLVEDNPSDAELTSLAFGESRLAVNLSVVGDGEAALNFLNRRDLYANAPLPDLVLLDLNLPKIGGHEVLSKVKLDEHLCHIPIVILTTSIAEDDIAMAYRRHANCYIQKPTSFSQFVSVIRAIESFWFTIVQKPPYYGIDG